MDRNLPAQGLRNLWRAAQLALVSAKAKAQRMLFMLSSVIIKRSSSNGLIRHGSNQLTTTCLGTNHTPGHSRLVVFLALLWRINDPGGS